MSATLSRVEVKGRPMWCVEWHSPSRRAASFWYFDLESEATIAHQRLVDWSATGTGASGHKTFAERD